MASEIFCLICFVVSAEVCWFFLRVFQLVLASCAYVVRSVRVAFNCFSRLLVAFCSFVARESPSMKPCGSSVRASCALGGSPPLRYWARAAAPACCVNAAIRTWESTSACAVLAICAFCSEVRCTARL